MAGKVPTIERAISAAEDIRSKNKKIVLVGGCFDILHVGHITFLKSAKEKADVLFVLLESDETIKKVKGDNRPINTQNDRALILESLSMVDYVVKLPEIKSDEEYDDLVISIKPAIIAITAGDPMRSHKDRQGKLIGAKVIEVVDPISNKSTTKLVNILNEL